MFAADDARVIRASELRELYEIAGDYRTLAKALGVSISTLSAWLNIRERAGMPTQEERIEAVKARLGMKAES